MPGNAGSIRAGRAFVELYADDNKLVRTLKRGEAKLRAFGQSVSDIGSSLLKASAAIVAPAAVYGWRGMGPLFAGTCAMCAVLLWRHEGNIRTLLRGEESRIGEKKAAT